jgi:hypothetical protein
MSEPATGRDAHSRVNRSEIALWVIGVVLVVASLVFALLAIEYLYSPSRPAQMSIFAELVQVALQLAPGILTAGLVSIILAIMVRALRANVRHPAIAAAPSPVVELTEIVQPGPVPSRALAQIDHSLFMRPSEDRTKPNG